MKLAIANKSHKKRNFIYDAQGRQNVMDMVNREINTQYWIWTVDT